jgi:hypothetical protein
MTQVREVQKKYCSLALMAAIAFALIFLLAEQKPAAKGLILGTLFSMINFTLLAWSLPLQLNKGRRKTFLFCFSSIGARYLLMALPIIIAAGSERFSLFGTAAGLFMVQAVILFHQLGQTGMAYITKKKNRSVPFSSTDDR